MIDNDEKICYIKLVSGEELVSKLKFIKNKEKSTIAYRLIDPFLMKQDFSTKGIVNFAVKYMPFSEKRQFIILNRNVMIMTYADEFLRERYLSLVESENNYFYENVYDDREEESEYYENYYKSNNDISIH